MSKVTDFLIGVLIVAITVLTLEGGYSLYKGTEKHESISAQLLTALRWFSFDHAAGIADTPSENNHALLVQSAGSMPDASLYRPETYPWQILPQRYIQNWEHLKAWIPILSEAGYTVGGDVNKIIDDEIAIQKKRLNLKAEIIEQRGNMDEKAGLMPARRMNGTIQGFFDGVWVQPHLYGPRPEGKPSKEAQYFIDHYVTRMVPITITEEGYRLTLPEVKSDRIILVIGDSMVYGARMGDESTLPSFLQKLYPEYRVINSGIPSSQADDNYLRLKMLLERYKGKVVGVVYVHYENDLNSRMRSGVLLEPENAVLPIKKLLHDNRIKHSVYVAHPSVYISNPDIVRPLPDQYTQIVEPFNAVVNIAKKSGFLTIDGRDVVYEFRSKNDSIWAGLGYYCDWAHMSPLGNQFLAQTIYNTKWLEK